MRTVTFAAGLVAVLITTAACGEGSEPSSPTASATPRSAATPSVASVANAGGNTAAVCLAVRELNTVTARKLTTTMKVSMEAAMAEGADDKTARTMEKAMRRMQADAGRWVDGLRQQSRAATDPTLSAAVADLAGELEPLQAGDGSLAQMNESVTRSETSLAAVCDGAPKATAAAGSASTRAGGVGPGTPCPAPVAFRTAGKWKPEAVSGDSLGGGAGTKLLCEVDAEPAGVIGFIRVWSAESAGYKAALVDVLNATGKPSRSRYRKVVAGGKPALEVWYSSSGSPGRAFAVRTADGGFVVVNWKGMDAQEHRSGLRAYNLARSSLTFAS